MAGSSLWWAEVVTLLSGDAWSLGRSCLACAWRLRKSEAVGRFPLPSRRPRACQNGGLGRMGKIRGLGKHMTHSPRADAGSQPNPACGSGLCQQQKNNTLPKRLGAAKVQALPLLQLPASSRIRMSCSSKPFHTCSAFLRAVRCLPDLRLPAW